MTVHLLIWGEWRCVEAEAFSKSLEIETFLCKHKVVNDAQVVAVPTEKGNKPVALFS